MPRALDHLVVPARDLAAQAAFYARLGFRVGARNRHPWGTENHIIQLDGAFLELIGLGDGFEAPQTQPGEFSFAGFVARYLQAREGLAMLVLRSADAEADRQEFATQGIGGFARFDFARQGRRPDGTPVDVAFSLAFAASPDWPQTGFFVCQQHFPQNFWSAAAQVHANGARGVSRLRMVHPAPEAAVRFLAAFTQAAVERRDESLALTLANSEIEVFGGAGELPGLTGLVIRVADLDAMAKRLDAEAVGHTRAGGELILPASAAMGVELRFVA